MAATTSATAKWRKKPADEFINSSHSLKQVHQSYEGMKKALHASMRRQRQPDIGKKTPPASGRYSMTPTAGQEAVEDDRELCFSKNAVVDLRNGKG